MPIYSPQLSAGISTLGNTSGTTGMAHDQIVFQGGNNITLSQSNVGNSATIIFSGPTLTNYLTTAALSNHSHGNPTLALTNLTGTTASNSNGLTISLSAALGGGAGDGVNILAAGTQTANTTGTVLFQNANGVTFGMSNNSIITASVAAAGGAQTGISGVIAGTQTQTAGTVQFVNSNGISFGMSNSSQITASYTVPTQSVQPVAYSAANGSANFSTIVFANSNGVSFSTGTQGVYATVATNYQAQGAYLTTARASNDAIGLNTALTANGVSVTANSSGLSMNFPAFLTTAAQSGHSHGNPTLALTNINGTTASASNGLTLSLSAVVPAQTVQPVAVSGSNGSFAFSTLSFGNLNGFTFYTSNGSIVGSYTDAGAGGGVNFSAGTQSSALAAVTFANSNGVSFGLNALGVITASVAAAGGGGATISYWNNIDASPQATNGLTGKVHQQNTMMIFPLKPGNPFPAAMTVSSMLFNISMSGSTATMTAANTTRYAFGLYQVSAGSNLSLINSWSTSFGNAASSNNSTMTAGMRWLNMGSANFSAQMALSDGGLYYGGLMISSAGASGQSYSILGQYAYSTGSRSGIMGVNSASATSRGFEPFLGVYTATTATPPASIGINQINKASASANFVPHVVFNNLSSVF